MGSLWNRSGTIERYADDLRADGALAFFFQGGTTTPMTVFADAGETDAYPHPVMADANGRWPDIFVPYVNSYDVQVKSKFGEQLTFSQRIPNPNPIDTTVIIPSEKQVQTGMIHPDFGTGTKLGYVRLNGKTIGDATTGAGGGSEIASADALDLFRYLWNAIPNETLCPVLPGGRGSSPESDFGLHKTLKLPDMRGAMFSGVDDMGNTPAAGNFGTLAFTAGNSITTGSILGANAATLVIQNIPAHNHTGTTATEPAHTHTGTGSCSGSTSGESGHTHGFSWGGTTSDVSQGHSHLYGSGALGGVTGGGAAIGSGTQNATSDQSNGHTHNYSGSGTTGGGSGHTHSFSGSVSISTSSNGGHSHTFTTSTQGGETNGSTRPFNNMPITRLVTWYIKL